MIYRILYHKNKLFFFYDFENYKEAEIYYNSINNDNKILLDIKKNIIIKKKYNGKDVINKLLKYNNNNLYKEKELDGLKKYHIAILITGHFSPGSEEIIELQLNNYVNCTFDIFIVTEKIKLYGRFNHMKSIFDNKNIKKEYTNIVEMEKYFKKNDNNIDDEKIKKMFGKYSKFIKNITYCEDHKCEFDEIYLKNSIKLKKRFNLDKRKLDYDPIFYKIYKCFEILEQYINKNKINYDLILYTRPDVILQKQLKISNDLVDKCKDLIIGDNPICFMTNFENMKWMSKFIFYIFEYSEEHHFGEYEFLEHSKKKNLKWFHNFNLVRLWFMNTKNHFLDFYLQNKIIKIDEEKIKYWQIYI